MVLTASLPEFLVHFVATAEDQTVAKESEQENSFD